MSDWTSWTRICVIVQCTACTIKLYLHSNTDVLQEGDEKVYGLQIRNTVVLAITETVASAYLFLAFRFFIFEI